MSEAETFRVALALEVERERDEARKDMETQALLRGMTDDALYTAEQRLARLRPLVRATHAYRAAQREHAIRVLRQQSCERERVAMDEAENAWMIAADECDTAADRAWATEEER